MLRQYRRPANIALAIRAGDRIGRMLARDALAAGSHADWPGLSDVEWASVPADRRHRPIVESAARAAFDAVIAYDHEARGITEEMFTAEPVELGECSSSLQPLQLWESLDSPIVWLLDERGVCIHEACARHLAGDYWLCRIGAEPEYECVVLAEEDLALLGSPSKRKPALTYGLNGRIERVTSRNPAEEHPAP